MGEDKRKAVAQWFYLLSNSIKTFDSVELVSRPLFLDNVAIFCLLILVLIPSLWLFPHIEDCQGEVVDKNNYKHI